MESHNNIKDLILEILMLSKFTLRKDLRAQLTAAGVFIKDRQLRLLVEQMITDDHYGIASSERGYSLITSQDDLEEAIEYLEKKSKAISIRKNCLLRNFNEGKLSNQTALFI